MIVITINVSFIKILLGTFYKITAFLCNFALCCISLSYYIPTGHLCVRLQYFMCEISNWKSPVFIIEIQLFYFLIATVVNSIFQKIIRTKKTTSFMVLEGDFMTQCCVLTLSEVSILLFVCSSLI